MDINAIYKKIDDLFEENKADEAEKYMTDLLDEAEEKQDDNLALILLNELIGYYRQTSKRDELLEIIERLMALAKDMKLEDTIPYATTLLNVATGYRSIGMYKEASDCYEQTASIYQRQLDENDMRYAGLYNNQSLLKQELSDFEGAKEYQKKALGIALFNNERFEIAVSYTNLANTSLALKEMEDAYDYANQAIAIYQERNVCDPHYCAALSVIGMCSFEKGNVKEAKNYFQTGMEIIEKTVGKNAQYERMEAYYQMCEKKLSGEETGNTDIEIETETRNTDIEIEKETEQSCQSGLSLCREYFNTYGMPMILEQFSAYKDQIAAGFCGEGSDCFGYDDETSRDHDWGPGFCLWVSDAVYDEIGQELEKAYANLPNEFKGYKRRMSAEGKDRLGVMKISDYFNRLLGISIYTREDLKKINYGQIEDFSLAAAVNGEVFLDDAGIFTDIRNDLLKGYPSDIRYLKLAEAMTLFSQCGQYNYRRMFQRKDYLTADKMLLDGIYYAIKLFHYIKNVYPPHDKWLYKSVLILDKNREITDTLAGIYSYIGTKTEEGAEEVCCLFETLGEYFADSLYKNSIISEINPYLAFHKDELLYKSHYVNKTIEELAAEAAKIEFMAFDKVKNEGGRASCQNDWQTFSIMRKSQYLTWNCTMLVQYLYDFEREFKLGHNLITEKYGRMMESTAPEKYEEIKDNFPVLDEQKKAVIEQIVSVQMSMMEEFSKAHKKVADNARSLHTYEDNYANTSYETYLRGEISTYSDKMLQLYGAYVVEHATNKKNIAQMIIENTAKLYGYDSLEDFEEGVVV